MTKHTLFLLLAALLSVTVCPSCEPAADPDNGNGQQQQDNPDDEELKPGSYKFEASPLKGSWSAGDKIYVHGNMGSWSEVITLEASDISADGKTANGTLGEVTGSPGGPDGLYAAWPDESVKHINSKLGAKTNFSDCDGLITAAYLKGDTFSFIDVSSVLSFSVSGDYDSYALCAGNRDGMTITHFTVEYTSSGFATEQKQNTGYPFKYGTIEPGKEIRIWLPGEMTFTGGLFLYLGKDGQWPAVYSSKGDVTLTAGKVRDLGDISSSLTPYDGPAPKMPEKGKSTKYSVPFNELSGLCLSKDGDFLWSVGDDGDLARISFEGKVLSSIHISGDTEDITLNPETGDLLIALEPDGVGIIKGPDYNSEVSTLFSIAAAHGYGNSGMEGLTYYKDGKVYAGTQSNSHLFLCDLKTGKVLSEKKLYDKHIVSEIAGLCYDPDNDWLWIIDSENKKVFVYTGDASQLLGAYPIDGSNPESVCVDHKNSCIWVGDDYGSTSYLYRYEFSGL